MHTKPSLEAELLDLKQRIKDLEDYLHSDTCKALPKLAQQLQAERWRVMLRLERCLAAMLRQFDNPTTEKP